MQIEQGMQDSEALPFWKKVVLYKVGILLIFLWLPALFLPLFELDFGGLASSFMTRVTYTL
jgi:hypothetical protein